MKLQHALELEEAGLDPLHMEMDCIEEGDGDDDDDDDEDQQPVDETGSLSEQSYQLYVQVCVQPISQGHIVGFRHCSLFRVACKQQSADIYHHMFQKRHKNAALARAKKYTVPRNIII
jgi:hypothetical protein